MLKEPMGENNCQVSQFSSQSKGFWLSNEIQVQPYQRVQRELAQALLLDDQLSIRTILAHVQSHSCSTNCVCVCPRKYQSNENNSFILSFFHFTSSLFSLRDLIPKLKHLAIVPLAFSPLKSKTRLTLLYQFQQCSCFATAAECVWQQHHCSCRNAGDGFHSSCFHHKSS